LIKGKQNKSEKKSEGTRRKERETVKMEVISLIKLKNYKEARNDSRKRNLNGL